MKTDFIKIDLHVHTPASSCYKGPKKDEEYLRILRFARSNDIKILGISDHNSIDGYKRILNIKDKFENERKALLSITDSKQVKREYQK
jgi:predicted metal-dependent phosphoesterase TrpH